MTVVPRKGVVPSLQGLTLVQGLEALAGTHSCFWNRDFLAGLLIRGPGIRVSLTVKAHGGVNESLVWLCVFLLSGKPGASTASALCPQRTGENQELH